MLDWVSIHDPAARAAAKAAYCKAHPLPEPTTRRGVTNGKAGYVSSPSGHHHYYGGYAGQRVAEMAAHADCEPIPDTLVPFERDDQLVWIGQHGVYPIDATPDLFKASLAQALQGERAANPSAAEIPKQPGNPLELQP